jgi:hypothetical protein
MFYSSIKIPVLTRNHSWVFSNSLPGAQLKGHAYFEVNSSDVEQKQGYTWKILYGDGSSASGLVYATEVSIGGVTVTSQAVEAATSVSTQFINQNSDGLMGLGFSNTNTVKPTKQKTFFENIKDSLKMPLFTVALKKNATGTYDFGYIDNSKYTVRNTMLANY